jgi:hypothetical protein
MAVARLWPGQAIGGRALLLHGPRGIGKTSSLFRQAQADQGACLSLDHPALSIGAKIFLADPTLYRVLGGKEGNAREARGACALQSAAYGVQAAPEESKADVIINQSISIEVGGSRKQRKQADSVIRDGADWPAPGIVPLWCLGFGW